MLRNRIVCPVLAEICYLKFLKEMGESDKRKDPQVHSSAVGPYPRNHYRATSSPSVVMWRNNNQLEREPLLRRRSLTPTHEIDELADAQPLAGGTVLGIHNLAIVIPQFLVGL